MRPQYTLYISYFVGYFGGHVGFVGAHFGFVDAHSSKSIARGIVSPTLHIGDHQVVATSTARNIGVMMDSKASMETHVLCLQVVLCAHSQPE